MKEYGRSFAHAFARSAAGVVALWVVPIAIKVVVRHAVPPAARMWRAMGLKSDKLWQAVNRRACGEEHAEGGWCPKCGWEDRRGR